MQNKVIPALAFGVLLASCGGSDTQKREVTDYAVATAEVTPITMETSYPAKIKGKQDIEIRPNVSGFLTELRVEEGQAVKRGQVLFVVDPVPYQAALEEGNAALESAKVAVSTAQLTVDNKKTLYENKIISTYDMQVAENDLASAKAALAQAEAAVVSARQNLSYCYVTSPADGYAGTIPYRLGSLVSASSSSPLTTVSNIQEMYVYFSMPEKEVLAMTRGTGGMAEALNAFPKVRLRLSDGTVYDEKGRITTISGVIDQTTGSASMRATFANPAQLLRSGGQGAILIPQTVENAILVPQKATFEIQGQTFVYVLQSDSTITSRKISILSQNDGTNYVVTAGLAPGERYVCEGVSTLKAGQTINPVSVGESQAAIDKAKEAFAAGNMIEATMGSGE